MMVTAISAGGMMTSAFADTATVSGGTVNFVGQVVNAACSVSADSVDQTVTLRVSRTVRWPAPLPTPQVLVRLPTSLCSCMVRTASRSILAILLAP